MNAGIVSLTKGMILQWSGAEAAIPNGWHLCDGTVGTINLQNKFIVCAGDTYAVAAGGGGTTHTHVFQGVGHTHSIGFGGDIAAGTDFDSAGATEYVSGTTNTGDSLPPYYALCYIQKL